ncbi:hypothetical protein EIN_437120 [Entamoeba invadens IP1]|uniref:Uncharacterized protein n=1 Tax=Entamoeba invadens IP1 TaxID=370355 RepID=A0A0A1U3K0_ENTIV|nr:hypothetical protein EIN_437120 [Entamoeba invadens IP1]ELP88782.1 hypothetical protein EIN_437120 [Entamoeba invadens IP1]|eukprot:XP_004255553.1 hypothetical protein EIN_437120 [Entamoeba invadens IP1]
MLKLLLSFILLTSSNSLEFSFEEDFEDNPYGLRYNPLRSLQGLENTLAFFGNEMTAFLTLISQNTLVFGSSYINSIEKVKACLLNMKEEANVAVRTNNKLTTQEMWARLLSIFGQYDFKKNMKNVLGKASGVRRRVQANVRITRQKEQIFEKMNYLETGVRNLQEACELFDSDLDLKSNRAFKNLKQKISKIK